MPCSRWGLPGHLRRRRCRCALTAPFHPDLVTEAVYFLLHFPADRSGLLLATTVPCGVRTFLDPRLPHIWVVRSAAAARPAHSRGTAYAFRRLKRNCRASFEDAYPRMLILRERCRALGVLTISWTTGGFYTLSACRYWAMVVYPSVSVDFNRSWL